MVLAVATGLAVAGVAVAGRSKQQEEKSNSEKSPATEPREKTSRDGRTFGTGGGLVSVVVSFYDACLDTAGEVVPSVVVGLAVSTAIVQLLPKLAVTYAVLTAGKGGGDNIYTSDGTVILPSSSSVFSFYSVASDLLIRMLVLLSSVPLQLCEHSTVAFAAAISQAGGTPGLAFAFLLTAPSTNLASLLLLVDQSSTKSTTTNTSTINEKRRNWTVLPRVALSLIGAALGMSYMVDIAGIDLLVEKEARFGGGGVMGLPMWYLNYSRYVCIGLAVAGIARRVYRSSRKDTTVCTDDQCCDSTVVGSSASAPSILNTGKKNN
jgi:hypothetical protein